jgi:carboxypeptidase PM20D1
MTFGPRLVMSNLWLFSPLLKLQASKAHSLNAMLRTTIAPTIIEGGVKDNVIPSKARAVVNFRILSGDTVASVTQHVRTAIDDPHVKLQGFGGFAQEPSQVSDSSSPQFRALQRTIREVSPDVLVAPYLVIGATDARHYQPLSSNLFRFSAIRVNEADLARIHGTNERVSIESFADAIRFYHRLMQNAASR